MHDLLLTLLGLGKLLLFTIIGVLIFAIIYSINQNYTKPKDHDDFEKL